jgi:ferredoxin
MNMKFYINIADWEKFLGQILKTYRIYAPQEVSGNLAYQVLTPENVNKAIYGTYRAVQPFKTFFCLPQEKVTEVTPHPEKTIVLGVKNCDLKAIQVLDKIFLEGDFVDPFYRERREKTLIVSSDCYQPKDTCFCTLLDNNPFPERGFDLNLSPIDNGFLLEVGSPKGEGFIASIKEDLKDTTSDLMEKREKKRKQAKEKVVEINREFKTRRPFPSIVKEEYASPVWEEVAKTCVECGACTNICPSCYCFLLVDTEDGGKFPKVKFWDSCQHTGFARVAAGINPRAKLYERLRNRYLCKYEYRPENFGIVACTGCGRCVEACQGKIDKREVIKKLEEGRVHSDYFGV